MPTPLIDTIENPSGTQSFYIVFDDLVTEINKKKTLNVETRTFISISILEQMLDVSSDVMHLQRDRTLGNPTAV